MRSWKPPERRIGSQEDDDKVQKTKITKFFPVIKEDNREVKLSKTAQLFKASKEQDSNGEWKPVVHQENSNSSASSGSDSDHIA